MKLRKIIRWLALANIMAALCGCAGMGQRVEDFYAPGSEHGRLYRQFKPYPHKEGYNYWPNPDSWRATQFAYDTATLPEIAVTWAALAIFTIVIPE